MKTWLISLAVILPLTAATSAMAASKLGDMASFEAIATDTLLLVDKGDMKGAEKRITDFESAWDNAEPTLYPKDKGAWSTIDDAADAAISSLRAGNPDPVDVQKTVSALLDTLNDAAH
ncbi:hypothetical protein [Rhizobium sp.]